MTIYEDYRMHVERYIPGEDMRRCFCFLSLVRSAHNISEHIMGVAMRYRGITIVESNVDYVFKRVHCFNC
ncbi:hypothetical protein DTO271G3_8206 [Paecilomyces variotii]|nr:hypothetical protein DTO271G3_8206 [Paecilomyces variotii]